MRRTLSIGFLAFLFAFASFAQDVDVYRLPAPEIVALADVPLTPLAVLSPNGESIALLDPARYRARESVLHMLWEMDTWLDHYVKNAAPRK